MGAGDARRRPVSASIAAGLASLSLLIFSSTPVLAATAPDSPAVSAAEAGAEQSVSELGATQNPSNTEVGGGLAPQSGDTADGGTDPEPPDTQTPNPQTPTTQAPGGGTASGEPPSEQVEPEESVSSETTPPDGEPELGSSDESEGPEALAAPQISTVAVGDFDAPGVYYSLRLTGGAPATTAAGVRGTLTAVIEKYDLAAGGVPALPTSAAPVVTVPISGKFYTPDERGGLFQGYRVNQYRVSATGLNLNGLAIDQAGNAYFALQARFDSRVGTCLLPLPNCTPTSWSEWSAEAESGARYLSVIKVPLNNADGSAAATQLAPAHGFVRTDVAQGTNTTDRLYLGPAVYSGSPSFNPTSPATISGGAVDVNGNYYFSFAQGFEGGVTRAVRYTLFRLGSGNSGATRNLDIRTASNTAPTPYGTPYPTSQTPTEYSGDIAFDSYNNLWLWTAGSGTEAVSSLSMLPAASVPASASETVINGQTATLVNAIRTSAANHRLAGFVLPYDNYAVLQGGPSSTAQYLFPWAAVTTPASWSSQAYAAAPDQTDLGSVVKRATFRLVLEVEGGLVNPTDSFVLRATPGASEQTLITTGVGPTFNLGSTNVTRPLSSGAAPALPTASVPFSVTANASTTTDLSQYSQSYRCVNEAAGNKELSQGAGAGGIAPVGMFGNPVVTCTITLINAVPRLVVSKEARTVDSSGQESADPLTDESVLHEGDRVNYRLTFDNTAGTVPATIAHTDYLADVLDDADLVSTPTISAAGLTLTPGTVTDVKTAKKIAITGSVPAGQTTTVTIAVQVKPNVVDWQSREEGGPAVAGSDPSPALIGFELTNYLVKTGDPIPSTCAATGEGAELCTANPILAWRADKASQPLDGAALHIGGDLHYKITVRKLNPRANEDITGVTVTDDLTQVFQFSRWYPAAPVPSPALQRGVYFYEPGASTPSSSLPAGMPLTGGGGQPASAASIAAANAYVPAPVFSAPQANQVAGAPDLSTWTEPCPADAYGPAGPIYPDCFRGTWTLSTPEFTLPADAERAEVWFSVRIGFPSAVDDPSHFLWTVADDSGAADGYPGSVPTGNWAGYWQPYRQAATVSDFWNAASAATTDTATAGSALSCSPAAVGANSALLIENVSGSTLNLVTAIPGRPQVLGVDVPAVCTVSHKVDANYFVIRKDLLRRNNAGALTRAINLVGQQFALEMQIGLDRVPIDQVCVSSAGETPTYAQGSGEQGATSTLTCGDSAEPLMCKTWAEPGGVDRPGDRAGCARFRPIAEGAQAGRWRADGLPEGAYWLTETSAATGVRTGPGVWNTEVNVDPVEDAQLLAQSVNFQVGDAEDGGQLDVFGGEGILERCSIPFGGQVSDLPAACVNPTGYVMVVTDVAATRLPMTGGADLRAWLAGVGAAALIGVLAATWWYRRRLVRGHARRTPVRHSSGRRVLPTQRQ